MKYINYNVIIMIKTKIIINPTQRKFLEKYFNKKYTIKNTIKL